ncbi:MAG: ABC transporter ATP-binding protein [Firmicutes bacterium]|nr:ABC transporter ATP-binding protein [Bacillota bacterium]
MINVDNLKIKYNDYTAIKDINLKLNKNETCSIIGPSGCGKSTLLYSLAGILKPSEGTIKINNSYVKSNRKKTGLILQNYGLFPWKTVWENVILGLKLRKVNKKEIEIKATSILKKLNIIRLRDKYPSQLSGGQSQRVAIARTLTTEPDLLLMDEPFSSLDALTREDIQRFLLEIYNENNLTICLVTHNIEEAVFLGRKIYIMSYKGSIKKIIKNPHFGDLSLRQRKDFHSMCNDIRMILKEGDTND